jgi:hypothetical protein
MNRKQNPHPGVALTLLLSVSITCGVIAAGFLSLLLRVFQ